MTSAGGPGAQWELRARAGRERASRRRGRAAGRREVAATAAGVLSQSPVGPSGAERGGGWARRGWRAGRPRESSGIRPGGPPPPAAAPRAAARHRRLPGGVNIGGPQARRGAQTWGEMGLPPPLCFCGRGRERRADTRVRAGAGRAVRAPPARPARTKARLGTGRRGTVIW
jgi:hypothetical protein